jgi:gamma-glutamyltranspeptidase/glutathione hydrolase
VPASLTSPTLHAPNGMVCSIDHLASSAGVAMLRAGGSAADAAVAASAVLAVTSQHACGMGGDLFALVHDGAGAPHALESVGIAGSGADPAVLRAEGLRRMPFRRDIRSVTIPGCVDGWLALHARFGRLPLGEVLAPARSYAAEGFTATALLSVAFALVSDVAGNDDYASAPLQPGTRVTRPGVAAALDAIVDRGRDGFYGGPFGDGLIALGGGWFAPEDLARPLGRWVDPLRAQAWGHDVWTVPPPSQGYLTLAGAWIVEQLDLPQDPDDVEGVHLLVEAARWAAHDRPSVLHEGADGSALLSADRLAERRDAIDRRRRTSPRIVSRDGGTTYLCAVDAERMGVSLIQSNAADWGAHIVEPATRLFLQNRGIGFSLEPGHPAELGPGRRPPHTLAPALVTDATGALRAVLGTMGGDSQPQIVLQLLARLLHAQQSPGAAISAPRWRVGDGSFHVWEDGPDHVAIEDSAPAAWDQDLRDRGHEIERRAAGLGFGHAHLIEVMAGGSALAGAADPRAVTGAATGY